MIRYRLKIGCAKSILLTLSLIHIYGDFANKIGTYMVAVLARRHGIPFYVAAPLSSIDRKIASGAEIPIEERSGAEVRGFGALQWASDEVAVRNPAFDVTPAELVSALITERGLVAPPTTTGIAALFDLPAR